MLDPQDLHGQPSHPTRVRGLKLCRLLVMLVGLIVAPHAGAWIETTAQVKLLSGSDSSHPTLVRGLKLLGGQGQHGDVPVAPHAGAWIETSTSAGSTAPAGKSHPTRVRGLKPTIT